MRAHARCTAQVLAAKEFRSPVQIFEKASFFHIRSSNVYLVAATRENVNASMAFQFLFALVEVFKGYFGGGFDEETVRDNFPLVYELLDEVMDFGYPQLCSTDLLKTFIMQEGEHIDPARAFQSAKLLPAQVTGAVSWRREGIKYRKNEVFLDVVEHVNLLMSASGQVLKSDVTGEVVMKTFLTGMPECTFGLNDKLMMQSEGKKKDPKKESGAIEMEDVSFHQCVKLGKFDSDKAVTFIPPDGEFVLMKYRVTENINLPFKVSPIVKELGRTRIEINIKVKAQYSSVTGLNVLVRIPLPANTAKVTSTTTAGKAKYEPETSELVWRMRKFPGDTTVFALTPPSPPLAPCVAVSLKSRTHARTHARTSARAQHTHTHTHTHTHIQTHVSTHLAGRWKCQRESMTAESLGHVPPSAVSRVCFER